MPNLALDFTNAEIPDGWFNLFIEKAVVRQPKDSSKSPFIALTMNVDGGYHDGFQVQTTLSLNTKNQYAAKNLKSFLEAATGVTWETNQELQVEEDGTVTDVVSRNVGGFVQTRTGDDGTERTQVRMASWVIPEELPAEPEPEEEDFSIDDSESLGSSI